jgi:L-alanine-DL-glutamate epimerase-like enolase superfamily enzyme
MVHATRNLGRPGITSMAIVAVDISMWDLKAGLLGLPLIELIDPVRASCTARQVPARDRSPEFTPGCKPSQRDIVRQE